MASLVSLGAMSLLRPISNSSRLRKDFSSWPDSERNASSVDLRDANCERKRSTIAVISFSLTEILARSISRRSNCSLTVCSTASACMSRFCSGPEARSNPSCRSTVSSWARKMGDSPIRATTVAPAGGVSSACSSANALPFANASDSTASQASMLRRQPFIGGRCQTSIWIGRGERDEGIGP